VAFVDGKRSPVLRAYGGLCGVEVPAGRHVVRLAYESVFFKLGLLITSAAVAGLFCLGWPCGIRTMVKAGSGRAFGLSRVVK